MFEYLYGTVEYKKMDYIAIDINGVGYRVYFPLREYVSYNKIIEIISKNDYTTLRQVPKLGEKKAQIIILDLKGKLKNLIYTEEETVSMDMLDDLILALEGLGYNKKEIDKTLEKIDLSKFSSLEDAIKGILKNMRIGD